MMASSESPLGESPARAITWTRNKCLDKKFSVVHKSVHSKAKTSSLETGMELSLMQLYNHNFSTTG